MKLSIIVCTYNREDLILECLKSLASQNCSKQQFEVIVVDNNSTDKTASICKDFINEQPNFKYFKEVKQGLSHARNSGYLNANAEWVAYVDDDSKAHSDYVDRALWIIRNYDFDCFGGVYNAWYTVDKPDWVEPDFGTNRSKQNFTGPLKSNYMDGGNMIWKKSVLEELGGFNTELGMTGKKISYGEETYLQEIARSKNYKIGFDPALQIDHFVQPYKLSILWRLKSSYAVGKTYWTTFNKVPSQKDASIKNYPYLGLQVYKSTLISFPKLFSARNYYWQNFMLETFGSIMFEIGKIHSAKR